MFPHLPPQVASFFRSPRNLTVLGFSIAAVSSFISYFLTRKRITDAEREYNRRSMLALHGRITDGSVVGTQWISTQTDSGDTIPTNTPSMLLYTYMIGGVTYECAQDVTLLPNSVRHVRVDLPIQVRFDPRNPANSIVVAENWNGLRLATPTQSEEKVPSSEPHVDNQSQAETQLDHQPATVQSSADQT